MHCSKKLQSRHPGQVNFPAREVTFLADLSTGQSCISTQLQRASWILDFFSNPDMHMLFPKFLSKKFVFLLFILYMMQSSTFAFEPRELLNSFVIFIFAKISKQL